MRSCCKPPEAFFKRTPCTPMIFAAVICSRQQLTFSRCLDDVCGAVGIELRQLGLEGNEEEQNLAGVSIDRAEQYRAGYIEIGLIQRHLHGILRESFLQSVA